MKNESNKNAPAATQPAAIPEELFAAVPGDFVFCLASQCPTREHCLRHVAVHHQPGQQTTITACHPNAINATEGGQACPQWREIRIVRHARGFRNALRTLRIENYSEAVKDLINMTSRGTYYRHRNGETPLSATQQERYAALLVRYGASQPVTFDAYEESLDW